MASKLIVNEIEHTDGAGTAVTMAKATIADATITTGTLGSGIQDTITRLGTVATGDVSAIQNGWVHILTKSNSATNSINITQSDNATVFSSAYSLYMITLTNFGDLSTNGQLKMRVEYNGSFPTLSYRYHVQSQRSTPGDYSVANAATASAIYISGYDSRSASYMKGSMIMYINDTHIASRQGCWWQFSHMISGTGNSIKDDGVGGYDPSSYPITGLQFFLDGSSVTWNGTFKVFGLKG
jgi:hypothetical protein